MGYRHSRDEILDAAVGVALDDGVGALTFGSVSRRLGIPDRTVVYYFPTKGELVSAVLAGVSDRLREVLTPVLDGGPSSEARLTERSWAVLSGAQGDAALRVFLECVGLAVRGTEPYRGVAGAMLTGWTTWVAGHLGGDPATRHDRALGVVATLDGLLLVRAVAGPEAAAAAARGLGLAT